MGNSYKLIEMLLAEGAIEVLAAVGKGKAVHFKDLRMLKNERTGKTFSANTVSARIKDLQKLGAIRKVPSVTDKGRTAVAYKVTPAGVKTLEISRQYEEALASVISGKINRT